jgi:putative hydrolase of the HAD superfamily
MSQIRWVFFDFAGTLAFNDPPRAWQYLRVAAKRGVFVERRAVWDALKVAWAPYDSGEGLAHCDASVSPESYEGFRAEREADILDLLGVTTDRDTAIKELLATADQPEAYCLYPESKAALAGLREAGLQLAVVSNFNWRLPELIEGLGIANCFSIVVSSARAGYRKPHSGIYEAALAATGAAPDEVLFVGDSLEADCRGPGALGIASVQVERRPSGRDLWPAVSRLTELPGYLTNLPLATLGG